MHLSLKYHKILNVNSFNGGEESEQMKNDTTVEVSLSYIESLIVNLCMFWRPVHLTKYGEKIVVLE